MSGKPLFLFVCLFRAILEGLRENSVLIDVELNISSNEVSMVGQISLRLISSIMLACSLKCH